MNLESRRKVTAAFFAASCALGALLPHDLTADDALFQGVVVRQDGNQLPPARAREEFFGGVVIEQRDGYREPNSAGSHLFDLAFPAAGSPPRDAQRSDAERRAKAARIGLSIGISIGGSSRSGPRKPPPLGPKR